MRRRPAHDLLLVLKKVDRFWWYLLVGLAATPWYLAYFALVLQKAGVVAFWMPAS